MADIKDFSEEVCEQLGHYVYRLIDPRNGETFYVGAGTNNRMFDHARAAISETPEEDKISLKFSRILAIHNSGLKVLYVVHRHSISKESIFEVEAAVIDAFPGLSNIQSGHGSNSTGPMSAAEIKDKFALPTIDIPPSEKLVLININRLEDRSNEEEIFRQTQLAWRISKSKADTADFVLSVVRGVVVGAFCADPWLDATHANFPTRISPDNEMPERKGFHGTRAPTEIWIKFVGDRGKRIAIDDMKHNQYPIRYWNI